MIIPDAAAVRRATMETMTETKHISARLRSRFEIAEGLAIFVFEPAEPMRWEPGQYATIGVANGERIIERPYSICSTEAQGFLEFFVELVPGGKLTPLLWNLKVGEWAMVRPKTRGHFLLDTESGRTTHLMVATVTGIAPYVSMLRRYRADLLSGRESTIHHFIILHAGSRSRELAYQEEFQALSMDVQMLRYVASVSRPWEEPDWTGEVGRAEDVLRKYIDASRVKPAQMTAYLCGHPGMIQTGSGVLQRVGMPKENIRIEQYFPPSAGE
jgi:ferredoxin--NADP+ reductase